MQSFFRVDGPLHSFLAKVWGLLVLNLLMLLTSLPIITIGAAQTAGFTVTTRMIHLNETRIVLSYFTSFKKNFKKSTVSWIILLVILTILSFNWLYLLKFYQFNSWITIGVAIVTIIGANFFQYIFFYISRIDDSLKQTFINIVKLTLTFPIRSIIMLFVMVLPVLTMLLSVELFVFGMYIGIFIGISFMHFLRTFLLLELFRKL